MRELGRPPTEKLVVRVGIVAHDAKKDELCLFARSHLALLEDLRISAPEDTARVLEEAGLEVESLARDSHGGDLQIAASVVDGVIDAVIFVRDPLLQLSGEPSIDPMLKVCDLENVPIATNLAAAEILLRHLNDLRTLVAPSEKVPFEVFRPGRVVRMSNHPSRRGSRRRTITP